MVANNVPAFGSGPGVCTLAEFELWRRSGLFEAAAALDTADYTLEGHGHPERIYGARVTSDFFHVFETQPVLGRALLREDATAGHDDVVVLSHQLWARRFQSDRNIVGKSILLSGTRMTVIGVMPSGFEFPRLADVSTIMSWAPEQSEFWVPLTITQKMIQSGNFNYYVLGRLRAGVPPGQAAAQFRTAAVGLFRQAEIREPAYRRAIEEMLPLFRVQITPLGESMAWGIRDVLWMLLAAVALLLALLLFNLGKLTPDAKCEPLERVHDPAGAGCKSLAAVPREFSGADHYRRECVGPQLGADLMGHRRDPRYGVESPAAIT